MAKRQKAQKIDGLGTRELSLIHSAVRQVWQRGRSRALVIKRCTGKDGFLRCESCKKKTPQIKVDHIEAVGQVGGPNYIQRMFVPSAQLQGLCKKCHGAKTRAEKQVAAAWIAFGAELDKIGKKLGVKRKSVRGKFQVDCIELPYVLEADDHFRKRIMYAIQSQGKMLWVAPGQKADPDFKGKVVKLKHYKPRNPHHHGVEDGKVKKDTPKRKRDFTEEF